jgi:hypothetical protein
MRRLKLKPLRAALWGAAAAFAVAIFGIGPAFAQGAVQTLGPVIPGHNTMWLDPGYIMDAGGPTGNGLAPVNNFNPGSSPLGSQWVNSGLGQCGFSAYANTTYSSFCWGFDGNGNGLITLANSAGITPNFSIKIGNTTYPFPGPGNGNVLGPNSTTSGDIAVWDNAGGTLLKDESLGSLLSVGFTSVNTGTCPVNFFEGSASPTLIHALPAPISALASIGAAS